VIVELFLAGSPADSVFDAAVAETASRLRSALPSTANVTSGRRIDDPARANMEASGLRFDDDLRGYLAAALEGDDARRHLADAVESLHNVVDRPPSRCAVSVRRPVIDGTGPIGLFHLLRRKPGLTAEAFLDYWGGDHTRFSRSIPGLNAYIQHHVDPHASSSLARDVDLPPADFDGVAVTYTSSVAAHVELMGRPRTNAGVRDNDTFVAVDRSPYVTLFELCRT
jgi:hypothetical protein